MPIDHLPTYVDVKFESMLQEVEESLNQAKRQISRKPSDTIRNELKEVCRRIRATKLHLSKILESYGINYDMDQIQSLLDLTIMASDFARRSGFTELQNSLNRHADEIQVARAACIDEQ